ncbi:CCA tRNA nucleotidyltransferase [Rhizobiaceae bacterium BDR2-2]|uniref:CCA tRNA nucleotidyltransferase n=1 Tax=Ectorhizobium quercum TaxID=2965071 RepID=A0AAE3MY38_9HYPH|nr:CCA tRNA nucleotidyltransferase [Ectorhizobium quercum]MCX8996596.1 CCA tRNA nucleotidyltransferase [Ectorhizobium quercum]
MTNVAGQDWFQDAALQRVLGLLNSDGGEARVAGGAVRNALMGHPINDADIATTLVPQEVIARAGAAGIRAVPTGIEHGTVTLVVNGRPFEVTTLRHDAETDGRRAVVVFGTDWQEDANRRDLTINGLYADAEGHVIDLVGGLDDIRTKTVRFIGNADERIAEDYLRILRFFRFFAWYGGGRPDPDGMRACARGRPGLKTLSAERVWSELKKLLAAPDPGRALLWMRQIGVLTDILPESEKWGIDAIPALVDCEQSLGWTPDPLLRLAAIVPPDAERLAAMAERLRLSKAEAGFFRQWALAPAIPEEVTDAVFARLLYRHGAPGIAVRLRLALASARAEARAKDAAMLRAARLSSLLKLAERFERPRFPLTGADVLKAGVPAGPRVGQVLERLESQWVEMNFSLSREKLLERLEKHAAEPG